MSRVVELETHCFGKSYAVKGSVDDDSKAENVISRVLRTLMNFVQTNRL